MRIHSGEKLYISQTCERSFSRADSLKTQMWIHTGEKPFTCQTCDKSFSRAETLKMHYHHHIYLFTK